MPPAHADSPPTPGIKINDETSFCTSAFTAQGNDGNYYLMTSAHCDAHDGSVWMYGDNQAPLGKIAKGEYEENPDTGTQTKDADVLRAKRRRSSPKTRSGNGSDTSAVKIAAAG